MNLIAFIFALIALIGTVVAGVMYGSSLDANANQIATTQLIKQVAMNMQLHYTKSGSFSGATTATEIANGDIPAGAIPHGASAPVSAGGAQLSIAGTASVEGGTQNAVGISLAGLPAPLCIQLASTIAAYGVNQGGTVGSGVNTADRVATDAQAASLCGQGGALNTLTWTFLLSSAPSSVAASQPASLASTAQTASSSPATSSPSAQQASTPSVSSQPLDTLGHSLYNLSASLPSANYPGWSQACTALCTQNGLRWDQKVTQSGGQVVSCGCE